MFTWWPAGAQLSELLGQRYAVIGTGVGESEANGIARAETGSLEARLVAVSGTAVIIPTHRGQGMPASEVAALVMRSGTAKNLTYNTVTPQSFTDFDYLCVVDSTPYSRGAPPPYDWKAPASKQQ